MLHSHTPSVFSLCTCACGVHQTFLPPLLSLALCEHLPLHSFNTHIIYTSYTTMARVKCSWSQADDDTLVRALRDCKDLGLQSDSGWKSQAWQKCAEALKDSSGPQKTPKKIQDHYANLKAGFLAVRKLREQSGFGWDDGLKIVTASDDVWAAYLAARPKAEHWRKTPLPAYDDMLILVDGIVATGVGAFHAGAQADGTTQAASQAASQGHEEQDAEAGNASIDERTLINDDLISSSPPVAPHTLISQTRRFFVPQ
ncbi:Myb-like domain-containing protein [Mycena venus]|uniref:Myb-like domain-containing protein n=1 Tax=Mycena venus TaxID=2733690 RepID=A0A8H6YH16_9AGAR|nr:Myb-like domain-containing protein [Mycena venus]